MFGWPDGFIPVVEIEIAPGHGTDRETLVAAISALGSDARCAFKIDPTGIILVGGIDERDVVQKLDELRRRCGGPVTAGPPQIAYRETVGAKASVDYTHTKLAYGAPEYARVVFAVEPAPGGADAFRSEAVNEPPEDCLEGVRQGVEAGLLAGVIAGFPVINVAVALKDCAFHEIDSSQQSFQIAGLAALRKALMNAKPLLLEPIMHVVIETPRDFVPAIIDDLRLRRGVIPRQADVSPPTMRIVALVPAANLLGYASTLRHISRGRASYDVSFDHYAPVPPDSPFRAAVAIRA